MVFPEAKPAAGCVLATATSRLVPSLRRIGYGYKLHVGVNSHLSLDGEGVARVSLSLTLNGSSDRADSPVCAAVRALPLALHVSVTECQPIKAT